MNNETLLLIFVCSTCAAVVLQALVLIGMLLTVRKGLKVVQEQMQEVRTNVLPLVKDTKEFIAKVAPKVETLASDCAALSSSLRAQSEKIDHSTTEILQQVHRQTSRVDAMLTHMLDTADRAGAAVSEAVSAPVRQLSGIAAFVRAAFTTLRHGPQRDEAQPQSTHSPADKDLFV